MKNHLVFIVLILSFTCLFAENYDYQEVIITSFDNTKISANVYIPKTQQPQKFPTIIFANSWAMDEYQYTLQAELFAKKGYIVFNYSSRGWGKSGGMVSVASPKDMKDLSACIDWIIANTPVDQDNIGISGISYGAGISLLAVAHDKRLKTAVAMSGWGDLASSLYGNETPHLVWGTILLGSGYLTGNMDPIIEKHYNNLMNHTNVAEALAWAGKRSPLTYVDELNKRKVPIYISNNLHDEMFQPNSVVELFSKLQGPKRLDLNLGIHASAELGGLLGIDNYIWKNTHDWFDYWLKGIDTGILKRPMVNMAIKNTEKREEYNNWPIVEAKSQTFYLHQRDDYSDGKLEKSAQKSIGENKITTGILSGLSSGIPVIGAIFEAYTPIKVTSWLPGVDQQIGIVYQSKELEKNLKIRGTPRLEINFKPSHSQMQLVAHLYDVDSLGFGTLITHAPITLHKADPGKSAKINLDFVSTTYNIPKGHKLALGIDTYDLNYNPPSLEYFNFKFSYGEKYISKLTLPCVE